MADEPEYKINTGDEIPPFVIKDHEGFEINEDDLIGSPLVLYFYPKDDTSICTEEACSFRDNMNEMDRYDTLVLGVSPDGAESHSSFIKKNKLNFTLLCDENMELAKKFDVVRDGGEIERSTFVIDADGKVRWIERAVEMKGHLDRVLKAVKEYSDIDEEFQQVLEQNAKLEEQIQESLKKETPPPKKKKK